MNELAGGVRVVAALALRESLRRRVFLVVVALTVAFGGLYAWGASTLFDDVSGFDNRFVDAHTLAGATLVGLAMFGVLFLGVVLAVFFTLNAVRGDAERGLLQPLVVRPLGRGAYLLGRFGAATAVASGYVVVVFLGTVLITRLVGDYTPDRILAPALELAAAVAIVAALALLGSVRLGTTANGIGVLMIFGAGLLSGLLGSIGDALHSHTLTQVANVTGWVLPFEGLYRDALARLVDDASGPGALTRQIVQLGPPAARTTPAGCSSSWCRSSRWVSARSRCGASGGGISSVVKRTSIRHAHLTNRRPYQKRPS